MQASVTKTKDGKLIIIDLDKVRLLVGNAVLFKNDPKMYDIGDEAADAIRELFTPHSCNEKSKYEVEVEERTESSCASLTGGTRSVASVPQPADATERVPSTKAEGRKTPKSAVDLGL